MKVYTVIRSWVMEDMSDSHLVGVFLDKEVAADAALTEYNNQVKRPADSIDVVILETEVNNVYLSGAEPKEIWWNGRFWKES